MTTEIRSMERADIPRVLPLLRAVHPCRVLTEEAVRWRMDHPSPGVRETVLLAVEGEEVVGFLRSVLRSGGEGPRSGRSLLASVAASHRDTDVGARLMGASERHLVGGGAEVLRTEVAEESLQVGGEALRRTVLDLGYAPEETHHILGLDLSALPGLPEAPEGVELRPFSDYADDPREVYEIDRLTSLDEPGPDHWFPPYEDWRQDTWEHPLSAPDLSLLALVEGVPAAITCYFCDREARVESSMTGTLREFRGRGLAGYAKAAALHRARERGVRHAYTGNHEDNAPMLAVNERLGYAPVGSETVYVKRLRA
ncbi:GCN5 family acetyltransferase [Nocardiopsis sp. TSRI0078]|uniref:GNAT family N-acetyltransferase n=1 Tax=unclassified Nocardiopsis TaxID=2649073 RepID=UPI00093C35DE|nr:GNAT family N-acetyltransferase [Nocardiopsis sp. TSRI0078]OKI17662.1 GCN5 family acetyltransferase [Nocardiopsis sp. TSRI0078]